MDAEVGLRVVLEARLAPEEFHRSDAPGDRHLADGPVGGNGCDRRRQRPLQPVEEPVYDFHGAVTHRWLQSAVAEDAGIELGREVPHLRDQRHELRGGGFRRDWHVGCGRAGLRPCLRGVGGGEEHGEGDREGVWRSVHVDVSCRRNPD